MAYEIITTRQQRVLYTAWELGAARASKFRREHGDVIPTAAMPARNRKGQFRRLCDAVKFARRVESAVSYMAGKIGKGDAGSVFIKREDGTFVVHFG